MSTVPGKGTILSYGMTTGGLLPIGQVIDIDGPSLAHGTRELTHLGSSAREFANSIHDAGEITFNLFYNTTNAAAREFESLVAAATTMATTGHAFRVVLSSPTTKHLAFNGIPTGHQFNGFNVDGTVQAACSIKITALVTLPTTT